LDCFEIEAPTKVEGAKPSLADDLVFLLIGPLFEQDKLVAILRGKGLTHA
jgi:uncharacterized membrane protein YGL010W